MLSVETSTLVVVTTLVVLLASSPGPVSSASSSTGAQSEVCSFPLFLGLWTPWQSAISAERRVIGVVWTFDTSSGGLATSTNYTDTTAVVYRSYRCVQKTTASGGNRLFVRVLNGVDTSSNSEVSVTSLIGYQCLEFTQRSSYVVQV